MPVLLDHLKRKIDQVERDRWGEKQAPVIRLADMVEDETGRLSGRIEILLRRRDGSSFVFHSEPIARAATREAVEDCLAEALSIVLSRHAAWPGVEGAAP